MSKTFVIRLAVLCAALVSYAFPAAAEPGASDWVRSAESDVRLVAGRTAVDDRDTVRLGLHFELKPGWKVYWRSAGDAGYPPSIDWTGSENLGDTAIEWPVPHRFELFGIQTAGYKDAVVFPLTAQVSDPQQPVRLRAAVDYLICADICIPGHADLALDLPAGPGGPSEAAHLIERYAAQVPGPGQGITLEQAVLHQTGDGQEISVAVTADPPLTAPDLFVEGPLGAETFGMVSGKPTVALSDGGRRAVLTAPLHVSYEKGSVPPLRITVADDHRGLEVSETPAFGTLSATAAPAPAGQPSLVLMLGLALLGGLILNLMPCVLPVLSLKVMHFVGHGGGAKRDVRISFFASALGIVGAFLALAGVLAALKAGGTAIGWGIQFQQPLFLTAMIALLTLFAANLWGLFEIPLPGFVSHAGGGHGAPQGFAGHVAMGAFATLLATPCSAPFLGTAVGFALARGPWEIAAIFAMLGLGMSLPYLAIAAVPGIATRLPRPGKWMVVLRKILSLALAGTAVWLGTVLAVQVGLEGVATVGFLMIAAVAFLILRHQAAGAVKVVFSVGVVLVLIAAAVVPLRQGAQTAEPASAGLTEGIWTPWSRDALAAELAAGKVVFVDVTADWCITCKVNKAAVIDRAPVADWLTRQGVAALRADWTKPNDAIAAYLAEFGRYGIPFNVVYGPGAPEGIPLPELLTADVVLDALRRAGAEAPGT